MATQTEGAPTRFAPERFSTFRFLARTIDEGGRVALRYALDDEVEFTERISVPVPAPLDGEERARVDGLLALLHWVAGVSYFKTAAPPQVELRGGRRPAPAAAALLEALYSEGLGEFAYANRLPGLPAPALPSRRPAPPCATSRRRRARTRARAGRRRQGLGRRARDRAPRRRWTSRCSPSATPRRSRARPRSPGCRGCIAHRRLDPQLARAQRAGALNGHVPVTAIVACIALLTAALNGFDAVAMANERSASQRQRALGRGRRQPPVQQEPARRARCCAGALAEAHRRARTSSRSCARRPSWRSRARSRACRSYHARVHELQRDLPPGPRAARRVVVPRLPEVPVRVPRARAVHASRRTLRGDLRRATCSTTTRQFEGFALLTATGGHKPFECVGEEQESRRRDRGCSPHDPRWREHARRRGGSSSEVLRAVPAGCGDPSARARALSDEHDVPSALLADVHALLGA